MNVDLLETYKIGNYEKAAVFIGYEHLHRLITKQEKCAGTPIDDFDLLIGASAVQYDMIIVTGNIRHFQRIPKIKIENWM